MKKNISPSITSTLVLFFFLILSSTSWGQVDESFSNIPTNSAGSYLTRDWTGDNGFAWQATNARTDQTINDKAITIRGTSGHLINNGGSISGGCGTLSFNYKRAFSGNSTMQVFINGTQYGGDITVSSTSTSTYSQTINISGDIDIEIKNTTSGKRIVIDDLSWDAYAGSIPTITISPTSLTSFTYVEGSGPSSEQTFTVEGSNLTNDIDITPTTNWEISLTSGGPFQTTTITLSQSGGNVNSTTIYTQMVSGLLNANSPFSENISCTSNGATTKNVAVDGTVTIPCSEPNQATNISFSNITSSAIDVSYTDSGADNYLVVQSTNSSLSTNPADATSYSVGDALGGGTVVYNGSGTSFSDNGLTANTTYYYYVFAYNNTACDGGPNYNTTSLEGNETTLNGPIAIYSGSFETDVEGWTFYDNNSGEADWERTTNGNGGSYSPGDNGHDGTYYMWLYGYGENADDWLITNPMDFSSYASVEMDFWSWFRNSGANIQMKISTDYSGSGDPSSANWNNLSPNLPSSAESWENSGSVDLSAYDGESSVYVAFYISSTGDKNWALDDYTVTGIVNNNPEIKVEGNALEIIDGDATPSTTDDTDFGIVDVSGGTQANTFTIKNVGGADLTINSVSSSNSSEFAISGTTSGTISAGNEITFTVTFDPSATGTRTSTITIDNDDANEGTYNFDIEGEGQNACTSPTAQATNLDLTINTTSNQIEGSFDAASPAADNYLIIYSLNNSLSSNPVDGTTYASGDAIGGGTVIDNTSGNSFTLNGLTAGTEYFFFIFANNNTSCIGGPKYNTSNPLNDNEITIPDTVSWDAHGCISNSTIELNWTAAPNNSTGYLLVVRQEAVPHAITSLDPSSNLNEDTDYSAAAQFGSTNEHSRVLYKGSATSITITNLPNLECKFKIYTYTIGANGSDYAYSSGTQQTNNIALANVLSPGSSCSDSQSSVSWSNPTAACFDEIMVVCNETSGIDFLPSGDGSAYTANSVYSAPNDVVYKGTGTNVTVTGLTNTTEYFFEIFTRKGSEWSSGVEVSCTPNEITVLYPGDLAIVAINTQYQTSGSDDEFCFFAFKDITTGTAIDFTDNGYERLTTGKWADSEGTLRIERTGGTIEKGTVICVQGAGNSGSDFSVIACGSNDDANWSISSLNGLGSYDLNVNDQIWIMQNGNWTNPSGNHNATYDGNVLYGWTATGWEPAPGYDDTKGSTLFDGAECFNTNVTGTTDEDKVKFYSDTSQTISQSGWIGEINSEGNWSGYSSNGNYNSGGLDYSGSCVKFKIDNSLGNGAGMWEGSEDNNWFNCANWLNMQVPNETIDVTILAAAVNEANIDDTQEDANTYGPIAKCKKLTIQNADNLIYVQVDDANDELMIYDSLVLEKKSILYNDGGGTVTINGNLLIKDSALIDIHNSTAAGSTINLKGNWTDNNTVDSSTRGLYETDGKIIFNGTTQQSISDATDNESFYNLKINNAAGINLNGNNITVSGTLDLTNGDITTSNDSVIVSNTDEGSIANYSTNSYINGNLKRAVNATGDYKFPVGTSTQFELANIILNSSSSISSFNANFTEHPGTAELVDGGGIPLNLTVNGTTLSEMLDYGFWTIKPNTSSYTVDYNVILTSRNHTNGGSLAEQHTIIKRDNSSSNWTSFDSPYHNNSTQSGTGTNPITAQLSNLDAFSDFAIARNSQFALPVSLLYFTAKETEKGVLLEWATASELNSKDFAINRSGQNLNFINLDKVDASGNSNSTIKYQYLDTKPINGISYYQLLQNDFDGSQSDLGILSISNNSKIKYTLKNNTLYLNLDYTFNKEYKIEVYNYLGQTIKVETKISDGELCVDLNSLKKETVYLIHISNQDNSEVIKYINKN